MTVPVMHSDPSTREVVRRGIRGCGLQIASCKTFDRIGKLLDECLVDAILVGLRDARVEDVIALRLNFPSIPLFAFCAARADDGHAVLACQKAGVYILVTGVDEPIAGELVSTGSAAAIRRAELSEAPRLLRLTEPIQVRAWDEILTGVGSIVRTAALAERLGVSREHLSREFAAGDAPNLKRVIDLARLACAAQMLVNPGYNVGRVARILGYSSPSHLAGSSARITGLRPSALAAIGPKGVLHRFRNGRTRSRL